MDESNISQIVWAEAVNATNYMLNRCLIRPIFKKTISELFNGKKPNIYHFWPLGYKYFAYNNGKSNLRKFDAISDE